MTDSNGEDRAKSTKVGRVIETYDLHGLGDELERRWTEPDGERDSLRTLADVFNRRVLEAAMEAAGMDPLDGEIENVYRLLTDEDVTAGTRTETEGRLRQENVAVDELNGDFVTYQAIRSYLQDVREASYSRDDVDDVAAARSSFERLIGRTTAVIERRLDQFRNSGSLTLGRFRVRTTVTVYCEECETQYDVAALLTRGGCACSPPEE